VAAGRGSGSVWLIPRYDYQPFGQRCQQLGVALEGVLGPAQQLPVPIGGTGESVWQWAR
jgi:hypothetical protein